MSLYAPRLTSNSLYRHSLLVLAIWCGLLFSAGGGTASARGFMFHNYGARPRLTPPDQILARGAYMVDARTNEVLYARNPDSHLLPASTTKLMTALIVYEKIGMNGSVRIVPDDTRVQPSSIPLIPGETVTVDKLFHALLIESANDAARALGRAVAGSTPAFVEMMNQRALAMGLFNTHFYNPNGLPAPAGTHYTSCADLMQIFRKVIAYPELSEICSTKHYRLTTAVRTQTLRNHNLLLGVYPGMGPAKTGWTEASKHTYAASVTRNGRQILLTLMDTPNKWRDAEILFNWGFAQPSHVTSSRPATGTSAPTARLEQPPIPASNAYQHGAP